jgi:cell division topological specificity factor
MRLLDFFRSQPKPSADAAKERLQILLAHDRAGSTRPDYLPMLQRDLLKVIAKYVQIDEEKVSVQLDAKGSMSMLEVNIELPGPPPSAAPRRAIR